MKRKKEVRTVLVSVVWIACILALTTGLFQKVLAAYMASVHLMFNHLDHGIMLYREIDTGLSAKFGDYFVIFETLDGEKVAVTMFPTIFPVLVFRDSFDPWPG